MNFAKKICFGAMILAFLLLAITYGPAYITGYMQPEQGYEWDMELNESQIEIANELWGSDITVGEFYETVCPEYLATMPEDMKQRLFSENMVWPKPT
jgi:hypothetical protein